MNKKIIILGICGLILIGILVFFSGTIYQKNKQISQFGQNIGQNRNNQMGNGQNKRNANTRPQMGEIVKIEANNITFKLRDGSQKIAVIDSNTVFNKMSHGAITDLRVGEQITITGSEETNGLINALNIAIGMGQFKNNGQNMLIENK